MLLFLDEQVQDCAVVLDAEEQLVSPLSFHHFVMLGWPLKELKELVFVEAERLLQPRQVAASFMELEPLLDLFSRALGSKSEL